jgi:hypothetical protein
VYKKERANVLFVAAIKLDEKRLSRDSVQKHGITATDFFLSFHSEKMEKNKRKGNRIEDRKKTAEMMEVYKKREERTIS